jgi:CRP/FNR family transcriptional regulator, dissimilatory nitrate respiration regulator
VDILNPDSLPTELQDALISRNLDEGETLFFQGDAVWGMFAIASGQLSLVRHTGLGQAIKHYGIKAGESFAQAAVFNGTYDCSAIADLPSRIVVAPHQPLLKALQQSPDLCTAFMAQLAQQLHATRTLLDLRSIQSAKERVLYYLHLSADCQSQVVVVERPLKEVAADLNLSPETFSRALTQLQQEKRITRIRREITLND